jgi:O-6-methylguanine DNA methyltransferase
MPEPDSDVGLLTPEPLVEPTRIRIPSALGTLGVELTGDVVTHVVIVPRGKARSQFRDFSDLKRSERSDFLDEVLGRFSEFLAGARRSLGLEYDLSATGVTGFTRRVLKQTAKIPYGKTRSYQQIAEAAGRPTGYRQVQSTLMANPLPLIVPCHRVVPGKTGIGSFIGGAKKKKWLLRLEERTLAIDDL